MEQSQVEEPLGYSNVMGGVKSNVLGTAINNTQNNQPTYGNYASTPDGQIFNKNDGTIQSPSFFGKGGMAQIGIGAISTLGSLWSSFQQNKIAKKSLALQEKAFNTNLANETQSYNTSLEDKIRTRYDAERRGEMDANGQYGTAEADAYIAKNKL